MPAMFCSLQQTDTTGEQYANPIIAAEDGVFEQEIIAKAKKQFCECGERRVKNDEERHQAGNEPLYRLHVAYIMRKFRNGPEDRIPYGRMPFEPPVPDQLVIAVAAFGNVPAVYLVSPWFVMCHGIAGYHGVCQEYYPEGFVT